MDLVVQNSTGPFVFKRTFRSSLGYWKQVGNGPSAFHTRPQWFTNLNSTAQWTQATMGGFDYVVTDPESGSFLYYYSNQPLNSGTHTPHTGFQIPGDAANDKKLYLDAAQSDGGITGYVLFTSSRHYYYFNGDGAHTYYLTRVEDTRYADAGSVTLANISTSGMTVANIGYSDAGSITTVTTGDGVVVIFNYSGSLLQSLSIDGGTVVSYAYNAGGLITQATYDDGTGEQYGYGTNSNGFSATTLTGKPIVSYVIDAGPGAGEGAVSSQTTEDTTLTMTGYWNSPAVQCLGGGEYCYTNSISDPSVSVGDGTVGNATTLTTQYTLIVPYDPSVGTGARQTSSARVSCSGLCSGLQPSTGQVWWFSPGGNYDPNNGGGGVPYAQSLVNEVSAFTAYPDAGYAPSSSVPSDAGFFPPMEYPIVLAGAANDAGAGALSNQTRTYVYGGVSQPLRAYEQMVSSVQQASPHGGTTTTFYNWDTHNNRLNSVVRQGQTAVDASMALSTQAIGTIYSYDARGRIVAKQGPCFVSSTTNPTGCTSGTTPGIVYTYYPASGGYGFNSNRLWTKTVCTGAMTGQAPNQTCTGLTTVYNAYDARGRVIDVTDASLVETISTYSGNLLVAQKVTTSGLSNPDVTNYGYDSDELQWVQHPSGMVDFTCKRVQLPNAPPGSCLSTSAASKYIYWKAKCTDATCRVMTESVAYQYKHGFVFQETYYDAALNVRRVVRHDRDPRNRPTFDAVGDASDSTDTSYSTRGMFDNQGNQIGVGFPYNAPSVFCNQGTDSTTCAQMGYDGLDRLTKLTEPLVGAGASQLTVKYDSLGHVSQITYDSQPVLYSYDDFGNLLSVQAPWLLNGANGLIHYAYDAQGHIAIKETPSMLSGSSEFLQYDYDNVGRPLDLKHYYLGSGYTTLWALTYDTPGSACPPQSSGAFTAGRVSVRTDSFGQTYYKYNFRGQVTAELRVRNGTSCTALPNLPLALSCAAPSDDNHLNTVYDYGSTGVLNNIQYPHGRIVRFGYPSVEGDVEQPGSVSADVLNGSSCATVSLLSSVSWEPYGGLRGYQVNSPTVSTTHASVEYLLGDNSTVATMTSCPGSRPSSPSSDHSGRLRGSLGFNGCLYPVQPDGDRQYPRAPVYVAGRPVSKPGGLSASKFGFASYRKLF